MTATGESTVYVDMDAVLLAAHQGRRGVEINIQADVAEGLDRLGQLADRIVIVAYPDHLTGLGRPTTENRIEILRDGLNGSLETLEILVCPHSPDDQCDCAKPGSGLIEIGQAELGAGSQGGWFIGADQEGVQSGRGAGLRTVRIGPQGTDHMSNVHRPDYEARDLLDAANHILIEALA